MTPRLLLSLILLNMLVSATALAVPVVNCNKAENGIVEITSEGIAITQAQASDLAYTCFKKASAKVRSELLKAMTAVKRVHNDGETCRFGQPKQVVVSDWIAVRADVDGLRGGEGEIAYVQGIECSGGGTGVFHGTVHNSIFGFKIDDSVTGVFQGQLHQTITVQLAGVMHLSGG